MKAMMMFTYLILLSTPDFQCSKNNMLKPAEYVEWVENTGNGLKVSKEIGDYILNLQYRPSDYISLKDLRQNEITTQKVAAGKEAVEELQFFTFQIGTKEQNGEVLKYKLNSTDTYYERINYFSSHMQHDLLLVDGKDTLPCVLFHFERTYGLTPYTSFNLGFPKSGDTSAVTSDKTLVYEDKVFNLGIIKLTVHSEDIKQIPHLIIP